VPHALLSPQVVTTNKCNTIHNFHTLQIITRKVFSRLQSPH
jgi:hypothetical protein